MIALANGSFLKETTDTTNGMKTTYWHLTDYLCPSYLICVAVGEFERVVDSSVDGIPVEYYAPKGYPPEDIRRAFEKTPSMIKWLQKKLDSKFPWPKYFQIASPGIGGGAMENISLVTWSHRFIMDEVWAKEFKLPMDTVNIHEMAHTYFGDLIVIRHFDQVWLKESWATYMESVLA
jgi:aminopeptidase N